MTEEHEKFPWEEKKKKKDDIFEESSSPEEVQEPKSTLDEKWLKELASTTSRLEEEEEEVGSSSWLPKLLAAIVVGLICYTAVLQVQVNTLRGDQKDSVELVDYIVEKQVEMSQLDKDITDALIMLLEYNGFEVQRNPE